MLIVMGLVFEGAVNRVYSAPMDQEIETKYNQTREAFFALDKSPQRKQRQHWHPLIEGFKEIYKQHPQTPWGEKSMFMVGRVSYVLFQWSGMEPDLDMALDHFSRFVNHYPQSPLADDALFLSAEIFFLHKKDLEKARQTILTLIKEYPKGDMKKRAEELLTTIDKSNLLSEADKTDLFKEEESGGKKRLRKEQSVLRNLFRRLPACVIGPLLFIPALQWTLKIRSLIVRNCLKKIRRPKNQKGCIWIYIRPAWP